MKGDFDRLAVSTIPCEKTHGHVAQAIGKLNDNQAFLLTARASVHEWLAESCSHMSPQAVSHLRDLTCSLQCAHSATTTRYFVRDTCEPCRGASGPQTR